MKIATTFSNLSMFSSLLVFPGSKVAFVKFSSPVLFGESGTLLTDEVISASVVGRNISDTDGAVKFSFQVSNELRTF